MLMWSCHSCHVVDLLPVAHTPRSQKPGSEPEVESGSLESESQFPYLFKGMPKPMAIWVGPFWASGGHLRSTVAWRGYGLWHQIDLSLTPESSSDEL